MQNYIIGFIIVFLLLWVYELHRINCMISGVWLSDNEFNKDAEIESMFLYIGPPVGLFCQKRKCYIIIMNNIINTECEMHYTNLMPSSEITFDVKFTEDVPLSGTCKIDLQTGAMRIFDEKNKTLFARMYKSGELSEIVRE